MRGWRCLARAARKMEASERLRRRQAPDASLDRVRRDGGKQVGAGLDCSRHDRGKQVADRGDEWVA